MFGGCVGNANTTRARTRDLHAPFNLHELLLFPLIHIHLYAAPERNEHVDRVVFHGFICVNAYVTRKMRDLIHCKGDDEVGSVAVPHCEEESKFRINGREDALHNACCAQVAV